MANSSTGRLLTEVGLRLIGLWYVCAAIASLFNSVSYLLYGYMGPRATNFGAVAALVALAESIAKFAVAFVIIRWAPRVATRFYPAEAATSESKMTIGPGDIYHTACVVLGAYCLVQGATFGVMAVVQFAFGIPGTPTQHAVAGFLVYTASGLLLIFGAPQIAEFIGSIRHDPESIPKQQFSLKMLLIVTGIVAVILGVARMISLR